MKLLLKFALKGPIDSKSTLVQVMACHLRGGKPLSKPMLTNIHNAILASWGHNELMLLTSLEDTLTFIRFNANWSGLDNNIKKIPT